MSPRKYFDRFMVDVEIGRNLKVARLSPAERWVFVAGVLPIAAKSDVRGALMVGQLPADERDVARQADVPLSMARSAMKKLRELHVLTREGSGPEWVHDFDEYNPPPKRDTTAAERQQRLRDKRRDEAASNADVTPPVTPPSRRDACNGHADVTPPEVEGRKEKTPPTPPDGGERDITAVRFNGKPVPQPTLLIAQHVLANFNRQAGTAYEPLTADGKPSENLKRILGAISSWPKINAEVADRMIRKQLAAPYWGQSRPHLGHVFGPGVVEQNLAGATDDEPEPEDEFARQRRQREARERLDRESGARWAQPEATT